MEGRGRNSVSWNDYVWIEVTSDSPMGLSFSNRSSRSSRHVSVGHGHHKDLSSCQVHARFKSSKARFHASYEPCSPIPCMHRRALAMHAVTDCPCIGLLWIACFVCWKLIEMHVGLHGIRDVFTHFGMGLGCPIVRVTRSIHSGWIIYCLIIERGYIANHAWLVTFVFFSIFEIVIYFISLNFQMRWLSALQHHKHMSSQSFLSEFLAVNLLVDAGVDRWK